MDNKHPVQVEYDFTGMCGCTVCVAKREWQDVPPREYSSTLSRREYILLFGAED